MTLPPGRAKLAISPLPTGSPAATITIGIVVVARLVASGASVPGATITSACGVDQLCGNLGQPIEPVIRVPALEYEVLAFNQSELAKVIAENIVQRGHLSRTSGEEDADLVELARLLRACPDRLRGGRRANQNEEIPPVHSMTSSARRAPAAVSSIRAPWHSSG